MFSPGEHILIIPADEGSVWPLYIPQLENSRFVLGLTPEIAPFFRALFPDAAYVMLPATNEHFSTFWPAGIFRGVQSLKISRNISAQGREIDRLVAQNGFTTVITEGRKLPLYNQARKILVLSRPGRGKTYTSDPAEYGIATTYDAVWLPDAPVEHQALGEGRLPSGTCYMGIPPVSPVAEQDIDFLVIQTGPEPYRTILERHTWGGLLPFRDHRITVVRNTTLPVPGMEYLGHYTVYDFVDWPGWVSLIDRARYVICRPDPGIILLLMRMGKQAILVPGNARRQEQQLAEFHRDYRNFFVEDLHDLDFSRALAKMQYYTPVPLSLANTVEQG